VGRWEGSDGKRRGFLLRDGMYSEIEPPGAAFTTPTASTPRSHQRAVSGQCRSAARLAPAKTVCS
jgi:hypothetical protein